MTKLRKAPDSINNWFDELVDGIGHRESSFSNIDRLVVAHDGAKRRFLICELKHEGEALPGGQAWMLRDLARLPSVTVIQVVRLNGLVGLRRFDVLRNEDEMEILALDEFRRRYARWWNR